MAGNLVTPWLHALTERLGRPRDLFAGLPPDLKARPEFQESGLYLRCSETAVSCVSRFRVLRFRVSAFAFQPL